MCPNSYDWYLYKKRDRGHRFTKRNDHVKTERHLQAKERGLGQIPASRSSEGTSPAAHTMALDF